MLFYITSNKNKVINANIALQKHNITLKAKAHPFVEIQSNSLEEIAQVKAQQAYEVIKEPLVVNDTAWKIEALNGFPGIYMQYINNWFTAKDFLNLIKPYSNRTVFINQAICYIDKDQIKVITRKIKGFIRKIPQGEGRPSETIFSFRSDNKSMAQCQNENIYFIEGDKNIWDDFAEWYKNK